MDVATLRERQALPLEKKIPISLGKMKTWYEYWEGKVYIAFSGGKDSWVTLKLVRSLYPDVVAVFFDTGLEFPEIWQFVRTIDNVVWVRPKMAFPKVILKYGFPVVSKEQAMAISRFQNAEESLIAASGFWGGIGPPSKPKEYRLMGGKKGERSGTISKKWRFLLNAPFKISGECCNALKKGLSKTYCNQTGCFPYLGMMAENSRLREQNYLREGCNMVSLKYPHSWPLGFWTEEDIWEYIRTEDIGYSKIYDMGYDRTGCMYCMFGIHMEPKPNRFQRMAITHPKHYKFCLDKIKDANGITIREVLKYMNIPYKPYEQMTLEVGV